MVKIPESNHQYILNNITKINRANCHHPLLLKGRLKNMILRGRKRNWGRIWEKGRVGSRRKTITYSNIHNSIIFSQISWIMSMISILSRNIIFQNRKSIWVFLFKGGKLQTTGLRILQSSKEANQICRRNLNWTDPRITVVIMPKLVVKRQKVIYNSEERSSSSCWELYGEKEWCFDSDSDDN